MSDVRRAEIPGSVEREITKAFQQHFPPGRMGQFVQLLRKVILVCEMLTVAAYEAGKKQGRTEHELEVNVGTVSLSEWGGLTWKVAKRQGERLVRTVGLRKLGKWVKGLF